MAVAAAVSESELQISKSQCATVASFLVGRAAAAPFSALDKYKGGLTVRRWVRFHTTSVSAVFSAGCVDGGRRDRVCRLVTAHVSSLWHSRRSHVLMTPNEEESKDDAWLSRTQKRLSSCRRKTLINGQQTVFKRISIR